MPEPAVGGQQRRARAARVPAGRVERMGRLAALLANVAGETALDLLRRLARPSGTPSGSAAASAQRLSDALSELRGAALKLGQMLSLQGRDLLAPELSQILGALQDCAHFMPAWQVQQVLRRELGRDWRARFREFDEEPLAAASIGQVHAAVARDGRDLALKVQYPGVGRSIDADVDNLVLLLRALRLLPPSLELEALAPELKRELHREADYRREADSTERYRRLVGDDPDVLVPRVHADLSTRRLLATDRVRARPIEDLRSPEHPQERRDRIGTKLLRLVFRELFAFRFIQTDPNFGNYLYEPKEERIALLDFGSTRRLSPGLCAAYRGLFEAATRRDRERLLSLSESMALLRGSEPRPAREAFARLCETFAEPLRAAGPYDFLASDLPRRMRDLTLAAYGHSALPRVPTPLLLVQRKLAGTYLLLQHLGARVAAAPLLEEVFAD
jgi:predicted unusual protein kinase regulating ubiquinone biosynthesis (AarF/ABC1/UbiB family)